MAYGKVVAAQPIGSSQIRDRLMVLGSDLPMVLNSYEMTLRDHAVNIDAINDKLDKLEGFYGWVVEAHPDILFQYKAIKDIQESSNENNHNRL